MNKKEKKIVSIVVVALIIFTVVVIALVNNKEVEVSGDLFELQTNASFSLDEVTSQGYPSMIDVGGDTCVQCIEMAPMLEKLSEDLENKAVIKFVDAWKYQSLANQFIEYGLEGIPTQFFFDEKGVMVEKHVGQISEEEIYEVFEKHGITFDGKEMAKLDIDESFDKDEVLSLDLPTLFVLSSTDTLGNDEVYDELEKVYEEIQEKANIKYIDVDKYADVAKDFDYEVLPTYYFYNKDGFLEESKEEILNEEQIFEIFNDIGYDLNG